MTNTKPLIVVCGATGKQGGSVVRFLLKENKYHLRGITRKLDSPAAQNLKAQGVEVVSADFSDLESTKKAFEGAYGVFAVTQFWETMNPDYEITQGKNMVDAANAVGVKHFVWSTLEHSDVTHFESKAKIDDYLKSLNIPRTSIYTAFYYENFTPKKDADGTLIFDTPVVSDAKVCMFAVEDTGAFAAEAFRNPDKWIGKDLKIAAEFISIREVVEVFNRTSSGVKARLVEYETLEDTKKFKGSDVAVPEELYLNFKYFYDNQSGIRDPELAKSIYPEIQDWSRFLERHPMT